MSDGASAFRVVAEAEDEGREFLRRLANAKGEMAHASEYDHIIVNDDLARAAAEFTALVRGLRDDPARQIKS